VTCPDEELPTADEVRATRAGGLLPAALVDQIADVVELMHERASWRAQ
jgi:hypothetical protein